MPHTEEALEKLKKAKQNLDDKNANTTNHTHEIAKKLKKEVHKAIVGQDEVIEEILVVFFSGGHVLLEGVPGTAKTLMVKTMSNVIGCEFERVQFTPDLMPSDVVGTHVFDMKNNEFYLKKGPIFTNFLLADEINRTPPKTQSALLEAMEERQATVEGEKVVLPELFMVFATQNPVEFEGTYPLPEAQMDRFFSKILIDYPKRDCEIDVLRQYHHGFDARKLNEVNFNRIDHADFYPRAREEIAQVKVNDEIFDYIMSIVEATRKNINVGLGSSPRGAICLLLAGKTRAALSGRDYIIPDDVKRSAYPVLRHRMILKPEAEIEGMTPDDIITGILKKIEIPR